MRVVTPVLPSVKVARRVLDEEIERHGSWWPTENCWVVVKGRAANRSAVDELTPVLEATAQRLGLTVDRLTAMFRLERPLMQPGVYYATRRAHRKRRLAEGRLRLVDHKAEPDRSIFEFVEPVLHVLHVEPAAVVGGMRPSP